MLGRQAQRGLVLILFLALWCSVSQAYIIDRSLLNATTEDVAAQQSPTDEAPYSADYDFDMEPSSSLADRQQPVEEDYFDGNVIFDADALKRAQEQHPKHKPSTAGGHPKPKPTDPFGLPPLLRPDQGSGNTCPRKRASQGSYLEVYIPVKSKDNPLRPDRTLMPAFGLNVSSSADAEQKCPAYNPDRYHNIPVGLTDWWKRQQKRDGHMGRGKLQPRYQAAPRWVVYDCCADNSGDLELPGPKQLKGINVLIMAFLTPVMPDGYFAKFYDKPVEQRLAWIDSLHKAGISVMVSTFGGDPAIQPVKMGYDPEYIGKLHATIIRDSGFDGLDFDDEDFQSVESPNGQAVPEWTARYIKAAREILPQPKYMVSAVPVAPWFTTNTQLYCSGLYRKVEKLVGDMIDWYGLQFYNQGKGTYSDCESILFKSKLPCCPGSSIFEIAKSTGMSLDKLVIGKPSQAEEDASDGFMPIKRLAQCVSQAKAKGWKGGVFLWEYRPTISKKFATIRGKSFPIGKPQHPSTPPNSSHPNPNPRALADASHPAHPNPHPKPPTSSMGPQPASGGSEGGDDGQDNGGSDSDGTDDGQDGSDDDDGDDSDDDDGQDSSDEADDAAEEAEDNEE